MAIAIIYLVHIRLVLVIHAIMSIGRRERQAIATLSVLAGTLGQSLPRPRVRAQWMRVRSRDWWERVVMIEFTDVEWRENFRMSRASFYKLCKIVEPFMSPEAICVRAPVPFLMRVAIVLYKLSSCGEYRVVANQFGVHKSSVKKFVYMFCRCVVEKAITKFIRIPTYEEAVMTSNRFRQVYGLPQVIGCVDGSHIPILPPSEGYRDFINRKGWASYVLQGVVDDQYW